MKGDTITYQGRIEILLKSGFEGFTGLPGMILGLARYEDKKNPRKIEDIKKELYTLVL